MKTLITTGILTVSLALAGTTAMAAPSPANPVPRYAQTATQVRQDRAPLQVAARRPVLRGRLNVDVAQFVRGMLGGGPIPYANLVRDVRGMSGSGGGSYDYSSSPSDDTAAAVSAAAAQEQAQSDEEVQAIQQMNDSNALNASMAAAEQQNDAANAATLQTEINAGM
jgi:hypothetical protein